MISEHLIACVSSVIYFRSSYMDEMLDYLAKYSDVLDRRRGCNNESLVNHL